MSYGVCHLAAIPLRSEPSERAEMVSQLLFGDAYEVLKEEGNWLKIKTFDCEYEGWMDKKLLNPLHEKDVEEYVATPKYVVKDFFRIIENFESRVHFPVFAGASFPYPKDGLVIIGSQIYDVGEIADNQDVAKKTIPEKQQTLLHFASIFLNAPYLWGGRTPAGIDCSGFTQLCYKSVNVQLPRDASQQAQMGESIDFVSETQPGDLVFFQNEEGNIVHVGMVLRQNRIIHASGRVRIDMLDETGIFDHESKKYSHFLRIIKRIL